MIADNSTTACNRTRQVNQPVDNNQAMFEKHNCKEFVLIVNDPGGIND